jgi:mRNA-degrading endonuclease RelE of RelBE toxin-antitoxin system
MTIRLSTQVAEFVRALPPEPRRRLRLVIRGLANGRGDNKALEGELNGYWRLRIGSYRVIWGKAPDAIECVFAERRSIIYEIFAEEMRRRLSESKLQQ